MQQELHDIEQFESQVAQMLDLLDYEYGCKKLGPKVDIPPRLTETFRRCIVQSRGVPAIRGLTEWAVGCLGKKLPDEALAQLYKAHNALLEGAESDTYNALELAALLTVSDIKYAELTLAEVATAACFVFKLVALADHVVAGMSPDLSVRTNVIAPSGRIWDLVRGGGDPNDLADLIARFFFLHRETLGHPATVTVDEIRLQIEPTHHNGDLPGFVVALWAAENGHLLTLNDAVASRVAAMIAEYESKRPFIEAELQLQ